MDKRRIRTLEQTDEPAPIDKAEARVEAEMKRLKGQAKEKVAAGLDNEELLREGQRMKNDAEEDLERLRREKSKG